MLRVVYLYFGWVASKTMKDYHYRWHSGSPVRVLWDYYLHAQDFSVGPRYSQRTMAPALIETPELTNGAPIIVPVKAVPGTTEGKPRIRRVIDEEGGTTTASVSDPSNITPFRCALTAA